MSNIVNTSIDDIGRMATAIAKSGLFGMKNVEEAAALMFIAQAEGLNPALAARDYHIIQGKPALKADAMMARFQAAGGKVEWHTLGDNEVSATFSHPSGGSAKITWDMEQAKRAGFAGKDNWKKFPRQMLRSRVISEGIRTVFPGVVVGTYTPEEVQDFDDRPQSRGEPKNMGSAIVVDNADKIKQYDLVNAINGICDGDELESFVADNMADIQELPELFKDTVLIQIESRREIIKRALQDGGNPTPEPYKFANVAMQDAFLQRAEDEMKRCETIEEFDAWKAENLREIKALEKRRAQTLTTMATSIKGHILAKQNNATPEQLMSAG